MYGFRGEWTKIPVVPVDKLGGDFVQAGRSKVRWLDGMMYALLAKVCATR
jgi:hypothetical protein